MLEHGHSGSGQFWTDYQPGMRASAEPPGTPAFFAQVHAHRYRVEPAIEEFADFDSREGLDVLDAGCGIGTDGVRFARAGANYTGVETSPLALALARQRFKEANLDGEIVEATITDLPFADDSFDLVYSNGVIHHISETSRAISELQRVLRPGGQLVLMVYHRNSINFFFTIMVVRRLLAAVLLIPGGVDLVTRVTGEQRSVLAGHRALLSESGWRYLANSARFLSHNTDGPGNPLSKAYGRGEARRLLADFTDVHTAIRFLNLRIYPYGERVAASRIGKLLERRYGWHLWLMARKPLAQALGSAEQTS